MSHSKCLEGLLPRNFMHIKNGLLSCLGAYGVASEGATTHAPFSKRCSVTGPIKKDVLLTPLPNPTRPTLLPQRAKSVSTSRRPASSSA